MTCTYMLTHVRYILDSSRESSQSWQIPGCRVYVWLIWGLATFPPDWIVHDVVQISHHQIRFLRWRQLQRSGCWRGDCPFFQIHAMKRKLVNIREFNEKNNIFWQDDQRGNPWTRSKEAAGSGGCDDDPLPGAETYSSTGLVVWWNRWWMVNDGTKGCLRCNFFNSNPDFWPYLGMDSKSDCLCPMDIGEGLILLVSLL